MASTISAIINPPAILGGQIESENKILHKFIDMTTENFNVELRKVIT